MPVNGEHDAEPCVMHVVGARPNFPKAAPVIEALREEDVPQVLVHTGQHYDDSMSGAFFRDLALPRPDVNLEIGSDTHARQTAALLVSLEEQLLAIRPRLVVLYGDVNSTLAAAVAAAKLGIRIAHVEAGLRSFDRSMPEEINRVITDQLSDILFTTSLDANENLLREGLPMDRVHFVGNPMIDTLLSSLDRLRTVEICAELGLPERYVVTTIHRPANVDNQTHAETVVSALGQIAGSVAVVLPLHPRGREMFEGLGLLEISGIQVIEPLGYLDFISLVNGASAVITDSGGVQEETTILGVPCFTLRPNTERPVTLTHGTNRLVTANTLYAEVQRSLLANRFRPIGRAGGSGPPLWDGHAGTRIAQVLMEDLGR